jgi:hypothetical protein
MCLVNPILKKTMIHIDLENKLTNRLKIKALLMMIKREEEH